MTYKDNMEDNRTTNNKSRLEFLDVVGGVMVVWMIIGHVFQWSNWTDCNVYTTSSRIFFMFMAWFFFKGGFFAKERVTKEDIINWARRLLIPFFFFSTIGMAFYWILLFLEGDRSWIHYVLSPIKEFLLCGSFPGNLPLWFLVSLFAVRALFVLLVNRKYTDLILAILLVVLYFTRYKDLFHIREFINYPYYVYNIFLGLIFYWIGYRLKNIQYSPYVALISIIILLLEIVVPSSYDFRSSKVHGNFLLFVLSATAACIIVNNLFKIIYKKIKFRILGHIGKQSMFYFCTHWIFLIIIKIMVVIPFNIVESERLFLIYTVGLIIMLPIGNKLLSAKLRNVI